MIERAVVLCAGLGTRLRPLTDAVPKPLLEIDGEPLLARTLRRLARAGVREVALNLHHLGHLIRDSIGDGSAFALRVVYAEEPVLLGSAGAVRNLAPFCDRRFAVVYGDVLADVDLLELEAFHRARGALLTMATTTAEDPTRCGVVTADADGRVLRFVEKPAWAPACATVNAGIYVCEPGIVAWVPEGPSDFGGDVIPALVREGAPVYALASTVTVHDIGTPAGYARAQRAVRERSTPCPSS